MIKQILCVVTYVLRTACALCAAYLYDMKYSILYVILLGIAYVIFEYCTLLLQGEVTVYNLEKIEGNWKKDAKRLKQAKINKAGIMIGLMLVLDFFVLMLYQTLEEGGVYVITANIILILAMLDVARLLFQANRYMPTNEDNKRAKGKNAKRTLDDAINELPDKLEKKVVDWIDKM